MKPILTFLLLACFVQAHAGKYSYQSLNDVNVNWAHQKDAPAVLPVTGDLSAKEWIQLHLSLVETTLRNRSTSNLTTEQKQKRQRSLDDLHNYWLAGNFPQNEDYSYRTPVFIDKHDNFCAVGFLVKASGHEQVSRKIAENTNLAYVYDMKYPELKQWARDYGFTVDELAWIQPAYAPVCEAGRVGEGTDGTVNELFADDANGKLYVGGDFEKVDNTITANNIAYVTESNGVYTWHNMGTGVNGVVNAIVKFDNKIFVAGAFTEAGGVAVTNVAFWDGSSWHAAGCTYGVIKDLAVHNGALYASGRFDVCAAMMEVNFAKWDGGAYWLQQFGITGDVNTMESTADGIMLGGDFIYNAAPVNALKWDETNGFQTFNSYIKNEVMDFEFFQDSLYAVCKRTAVDDSNHCLVLRSNNWEPTMSTDWYYHPSGVSLNSLCANNDTLMLGGQFYNGQIVGTYAHNCINLTSYGDWFVVDDAINKFVVFKNKFFAGGKFKYGSSSTSQPLNGITYRKNEPTGVNEPIGISNRVTIYPNPANEVFQLSTKPGNNIRSVQITNMSGQVLHEQKNINGHSFEIRRGNLASGIYMIKVQTAKGAVTEKLVLQ